MKMKKGYVIRTIHNAVACDHPDTGESMTRQAFAKETDVNEIMAKYTRTGLIDHINQNQPIFGEVPGVSFREALELVERAETEFMELPAIVRERFENDPEKYLTFFEDENNREEAVALGLLEAPTPSSSSPPEPPPGGPPGESSPPPLEPPPAPVTASATDG
mgnify:FL=1